MAAQFEIPIRQNLKGLNPYASFDMPNQIRLGTNENPFAMPQELADEIAARISKTLTNSNRYPSDSMAELNAKLAKYLSELEGEDISPAQILGANGSSDVITFFFQAFAGPGVKVLSWEPTYMLYSQNARDSFSDLVFKQRTADFAIDVDQAIADIQEVRPAFAIITNPNNPTGNWLDADDIERICKAALEVETDGRPGANPVILIDEAYIDFKPAGAKSSAGLLAKYPNAAIARTFSKAFALAGVRFGYAIANPKIIEALRIVRLAYNVSAVTQTIAEAALDFAPQLKANNQKICDARDSLFEWLSSFEFLRPIKSYGNFIMVGFSESVIGNKDLPQRVTEFLASKSIIVRNVGPEGFFRISIGDFNQMEKFKSQFTEFMHNEKLL